MTWKQDHFPSAAVRHLDDARVLAEAERTDGAVHAAGFAAECALKALLARALPTLEVKQLSHDVGRMVSTVDVWAAAVSGDRDLNRLVAAVNDAPDLGEGHPQRRYWRTGWSPEEAGRIVRTAGRLVDDRVLGPWIDRGRLLELR